MGRRTPSPRDKGSAYQRREGLRRIQIWVPDVRSPTFKIEARRQARIVAAHASERATMDFIEASMDWREDT
ncbi:MAG: antitoxin MazE family protein [Proteobacteria bacterium]|nr:antitoxin MazE family protein [Pseudomonadota bacterium]